MSNTSADTDAEPEQDRSAKIERLIDAQLRDDMARLRAARARRVDERAGEVTIKAEMQGADGHG